MFAAISHVAMFNPLPFLNTAISERIKQNAFIIGESTQPSNVAISMIGCGINVSAFV